MFERNVHDVYDCFWEKYCSFTPSQKWSALGQSISIPQGQDEIVPLQVLPTPRSRIEYHTRIVKAKSSSIMNQVPTPLFGATSGYLMADRTLHTFMLLPGPDASASGL